MRMLFHKRCQPFINEIRDPSWGLINIKSACRSNKICQLSDNTLMSLMLPTQLYNRVKECIRKKERTMQPNPKQAKYKQMQSLTGELEKSQRNTWKTSGKGGTTCASFRRGAQDIDCDQRHKHHGPIDAVPSLCGEMGTIASRQHRRKAVDPHLSALYRLTPFSQGLYK